MLLDGKYVVIFEYLIVGVVGKMNVADAGLDDVDSIIVFDGFSIIDISIGVCSTTC